MQKTTQTVAECSQRMSLNRLNTTQKQRVWQQDSNTAETAETGFPKKQSSVINVATEQYPVKLSIGEIIG